MPVVSISIPADLFHELEERRAKRSRSGTWTEYLKVGTKMDGHRCPAHPKSRWPDDHRCPESVSDGIRRLRKEYGSGWTWTVDDTEYHVSFKE